MAARRRSVTWSESARTALDDVVAYIARDSTDLAVRVLIRAVETASTLETLAERGRIVPELDDAAIRELFVFRYRLLYRVFEEQVVILAFLHGARDFATWRQQQS